MASTKYGEEFLKNKMKDIKNYLWRDTFKSWINLENEILVTSWNNLVNPSGTRNIWRSDATNMWKSEATNMWRWEAMNMWRSKATKVKVISNEYVKIRGKTLYYKKWADRGIHFYIRFSSYQWRLYWIRSYENNMRINTNFIAFQGVKLIKNSKSTFQKKISP